MKKYIITMLMLAPMVCWSNGLTEPDYMAIHLPYQPNQCDNAQTQQELDQCTTKSLKKARMQMQALVSRLEANYKENEPKLVQPFIKAQQAWQEYVEAECHYSTYYSWGGSGYQSILNQCLESKILERISYLDWIIRNP